MSGGEFRHLPVEMIDVPADRARLLNPVKAEAIGATMKAERQFDPITVSPTDDGRFELVDGQHRLHGAKHVGLAKIEARVIALSPEARRKQEILSNLATAELDALGRARSINALCQLLKGEDGRRRRVGRPSKPDIRGWSAEISPIVQTNFGLSEDGAANLLGWSEEAAAQAGIKRATLFEYLRVARRVLPEAAEELAFFRRVVWALSDCGGKETVRNGCLAISVNWTGFGGSAAFRAQNGDVWPTAC